MSESKSAETRVILHKPTASWSACRWVNSDLDDERLRAIAVGASFAKTWNVPHDSLSYAATVDGEDSEMRDKVLGGLLDWWGISNGDETLDCVRRLHAGMHAPDYEIIHPLSASASRIGEELEFLAIREKHRTFLSQAFSLVGKNPEGALHTYEQWTQAQRMLSPRVPWPTPTRIAGWDLVRSVFIVRGGYTAGYINADQAWDLLFDGLQIARREYGNWRQLGDAYLLGYMIWQAQSDLASWKDTVAHRAALIAAMNTMPSSPWRRVALHPDGDVDLA